MISATYLRSRKTSVSARHQVWIGSIRAYNAASHLPNVRITPIFFKIVTLRIRIAADLRRNRWTGIPY